MSKRSQTDLPIRRFAGAHEFLSNFYQHVTWIGGKRYPTLENAYQECKTNNPHWKKAIRTAPLPEIAKLLGHHAPLRSDWKRIRVDVMRGLLRFKFSDKELADKLLLTGNARLVHGNTWGDTFWGVCNGKGEDWHGRLLMEVRRELRGFPRGTIRGRVVGTSNASKPKPTKRVIH